MINKIQADARTVLSPRWISLMVFWGLSLFIVDLGIILLVFNNWSASIILYHSHIQPRSEPFGLRLAVFLLGMLQINQGLVELQDVDPFCFAQELARIVKILVKSARGRWRCWGCAMRLGHRHGLNRLSACLRFFSAAERGEWRIVSSAASTKSRS